MAKKKIGLKKDGLGPNVQLESIITTRCSTNMSKVTCASMVRNQRIMKKKGK